MSSKSAELKPSLIRTLAPFVVGPVLAAIATRLGLPLDEIRPDSALYVGVMAAVTGAFGYLYYVLARFAEVFLNPKWGYVLGLAKSPAYSPADSPSPAEGEVLVAEVVPEAMGPDGVPTGEPVQTDNRERPEDGEQPEDNTWDFTGEMR